MARMRTIRPEFFSDKKMAKVSPYARLFYQALWCFADDEGRGRCIMRELEGFAFPHEPDVRAQPLMDELVAIGRVVIYSVGDEDFFHIPTFGDYQKPNKPTKSRLPAPPPRDVSPIPALPLHPEWHDDSDPTPVVVMEESGSAPVVLHASSSVGDGDGDGDGSSSRSVAPAGAHQRNPWWDTLTELFGEPTKPQRSLYGRVAKLAQDTGEPSEILRRAEAIALEWGKEALTVASLEKHWNRADSLVGALNVPAAKKANEIREFLDGE